MRIAIVLQLRESHRCVHELVDALDVPQPWSASTCGSILEVRRGGRRERSGARVMYRLVDHHLAEIVVAALSHADEEHS